MLVVHPSSTCDVCLEGYSWATPAHTPHAIACGHVFCLQCLQSTHPSTCPLCRKGFIPERIKKLHVDRFTVGNDEDASTRETELLHRIAMVSGESAADNDVLEVINEVQRWLTSDSDQAFDSDSIQERPPRSTALHNAVSALHRYRVIRRQSDSIQESHERENEDYARALQVREQDLRAAKVVEENLLEQIKQLEDNSRRKLEATEADLYRLSSENEQFRSRYLHTSNPLPPPPQDVAIDHLASLSRPLTSFSGRSMPIAASIPIHPGAGRGSTVRANTEPLMSMNTTFTQMPSQPEDISRMNLPRQDPGLRPPVMVPGAPSTKKVVPPRPDFNLDNWNPRSSTVDSRNRPMFATVLNSVSEDQERTPSLSSVARSSKWITPTDSRPVMTTPHYGYVPGVGYVHQEQPGSASSFSFSREPEAGVGGLMLFSSEGLEAGSSSSQRPARTIEEAERALAYSSRETNTAEYVYRHSQRRSGPGPSQNTRPYPDDVSPNSSVRGLGLVQVPSAAQDPSQVSSGLVQPDARPDVIRSEPSPASTWGTVITANPSRTVSVSDLHLTGLPEARPSFGDLPLTGLPDPLPELDGFTSSSANSSLGNLHLMVFPNAMTSEPSSPRTSRNSSMSNLNLPGISQPPRVQPSTSQGSSINTSTSSLSSRSIRSNRSRRVSFDLPTQSRTQPRNQSIVEEASELLTPRGRPRGHDLPSHSSAADPRPTGRSDGLGLGLNSASNHSESHQIINGQGDLEQVTQFLMGLVTEEQPESRSRRHGRHASMTDVEELSAPQVRPWPGSSLYSSRPEPVRMEQSSAAPPTAMSSSRREPPPQLARRNTSVDHRAQQTGGHGTSRSDSIHRSRHSSTSTKTLPDTQSTSRTSHREHRAAASELSDSRSEIVPPRRHSRRHESAPVVDAVTFCSSGYQPTVGAGSLGLSLVAPTTTSEATTADGEPSSIHAPRPVSSRHASSFFGLWNSRSTH